MAKAKFPNQFTVVNAPRPVTDKDNPYAVINNEALRMAMLNLNGIALKLWLYMAKNQEDYSFGLGPAAATNWGIKKDSYYKAKDELIEKGYLVEISSSKYQFVEIPDAPVLDTTDAEPVFAQVSPYNKNELKFIKPNDLKQVIGDIEWLEDDVVKLPTGIIMRVLDF